MIKAQFYDKDILYIVETLSRSVIVLTIILLALALSVDAIGIGLSYGMRNIVIPFSTKIIIFLLSFICTLFSVTVGDVLINILPDGFSEYIGIGILLIIGISILLQGNKNEVENEAKKIEKSATIFNFAIKTLGISVQIIRDPKSGDIDKSNKIEPLEGFYLGLALSMDSVGIGIASAGFLNTFVLTLLLPIFAGIGQILFLSVGFYLGDGVNSKISESDIYGQKSYKKKILTYLPGMLMIIIAFLRLI